jgi:acyl carrier protein
MKTEAFVAMLEDVLRVPKGSLRMEDGPKTVETWDSLGGVTILAVIDQELHFEPSDELVSKSSTVGHIIEVLKSQGLLQD